MSHSKPGKSKKFDVFVGYHKVKKMGNDLSGYYKDGSKKSRGLWLSSKSEKILKTAVGNKVVVIEGSPVGNKTIFTLCGIEKVTKYELRKNKSKIKKTKRGTFWFKNGELHRTNGPAAVYSDGHKEWWQNGSPHRIDGPAIEDPSGQKAWYLDRKEMTKDEWKNSDKKLNINPREKFKYLIFGINEIKCKVVLNDFPWFNGSDGTEGLLKHQAYFGRGFNQIKEDHAKNLLELATKNAI